MTLHASHYYTIHMALYTWHYAHGTMHMALCTWHYAHGTLVRSSAPLRAALSQTLAKWNMPCPEGFNIADHVITVIEVCR